MKTHLDYTVDPSTGDIIFEGQVCKNDLVRLDLDPIDKAVLNEPVKTMSDAAQNLQIIFFRMEQQLAQEEAERPA